MAYLLIYAILFILFVLITYIMFVYPTNKLQLAINEINKIHSDQNNIDKSLPNTLNTVIFQDFDKALYTIANVYVDSKKNQVTIKYSKTKKIFNIDSYIDMQTLLPILLLSK
ncbi:Entry/fusion complex component [Sea otter poxvirus]|uniref:Entry-fusion complex protein OPG086 n=1 Tax=Sea otter poxvirus TaxID=1416741 RepID=A0A2U9QHN2_9POXV|nr:Entry/fusion complex component [Sea otter poxvirus]AWU47096.1 Entry/fusion complex component [Sea otter poxvirus]